MRKLLFVSVGCIGLLGAAPCYAASWCPSIGCLYQTAMETTFGYMAREWNRKQETIHYDVTNGLEKLQTNIGMYREQGHCGVSATGNSGCDTKTPESAQEEIMKAEELAMSIPDSTIAIITQSEEDGTLVLGEDAKDKMGKKGDTFDRVRENVASYMFVSDDLAVNQDCVCSVGTGEECEPSECAQARQNEVLVASSTAASSMADSYLQDVDANYDNLEKLVNSVAAKETLAEFVGAGLGDLSVYASSAAVDMLFLYADDLRAQSYRNIIFSGIDRVDVSELKEDTE